MTTDIFIRSYQGDFKWLEYSLASIKKYCTGFRQVVIVVPDGSVGPLVKLGLSGVVLQSCPNYANDYLGQQVTKLTAHRYSDADRVLFVDSDVVFHTPTTPEDFMKGGKIWMYKTKYTEDRLGQAMCWQKRTEDAVGFPVSFEYMRRMPLMYFTETLRKIESYMQGAGKPIEQYVTGHNGNDFSEFNLIGAYAEAFEQNKYVFLDTDDGVNEPSRCKQFWSWGGIKPEIASEIKTFLS